MLACLLQIKQFWRPSAWADAWYGYYAGKRYYELTEMPMPKKLLVNPSLLSLAKLCMVSLTKAKHAMGDQLFWCSAAGCLALVLWRIRKRAITFLNRNLIPGHYTYQRGTVKNTPLLLEHLRELQTAKVVLDTHLQSMKSSSANASEDRGLSSLSVMHSVRSHATITANLTSRLEDACEKYAGHRLSNPDLAEALMIVKYLNGKRVTFLGGP